MARVLAPFSAMALFGACGPQIYYCVPRLEIGPALQVRELGARSVAEPAGGSYYFIFHAATGLTSINHFEKRPGTTKRERLLYLETFRSPVLDRTVKEDEILKGPFGTLYASKTCFYSKDLERGYSGVSVGSSSNDLEHEIPVELSGKPDDLPPLTSLSLVRIFRADPEYVVISGNYEATGDLRSLHFDTSKGGDSVSGESRVQPDLRNDPDLKKYGIPARIDIERYLRLHRLPMPDVALPQVMSLLNQHYGYDKIIRVDRLSNGALVSSRFLQPSVTEEERVLNPVCEARFLKQKALGLRTVD